MTFGSLILFDPEKVFIIPFHQVFFPGIFLENYRIRLQLLQLLFGRGDLLLIILLTLFQL